MRAARRTKPSFLPRTQRSALAVRCRAGAVTNSGAWYGPGSAERHEECRTASGTRSLLGRPPHYRPARQREAHQHEGGGDLGTADQDPRRRLHLVPLIALEWPVAAPSPRWLTMRCSAGVKDAVSAPR